MVAGLERYAKIVSYQTVLLSLLIAFCTRIGRAAFKSLGTLWDTDLGMGQAIAGEILPI